MEQLNLIIDTYQRIILESESQLAKVKRRIYRIGTLRLILFAAGVAGIIYFWSESRLVISGIAAITFIPFLLLVKLHNRLFRQKDYLEKKIETTAKNCRPCIRYVCFRQRKGVYRSGTSLYL